MHIKSFKGWAPAFSRYILPPGGAVELVNMTTLTPGCLTVRGGSKKTISTSTRMVELWGLSTGSSQTDIIMGQGDNGDIVEFDSGNETTKLAGQFDGDHPVAFSQGRRGEVFLYQGYGRRGLVRDITGVVRPVGLEPPKDKPEITIDSSSNAYFLARIDITDAGSGYSTPPAVTIAAPPEDGRQATAITRLDGRGVGEIEVTDGGAGYIRPPIVRVAKPLSQVEDGTPAIAALEAGAPAGDHKTGVVYWDLYSPSNGGYWCALDRNGNPLPRWRNGYILTAYGGSGRGASMYVELTETGKWWAGIAGEGVLNPGGLSGFPLSCPAPASTVFEGFGPSDIFKSWQVFDFGSGYKPGDVVCAYIFTTAVPFTCGGLPNGQACPITFKGYVFGADDCPDNLTLLADNQFRKARLKPIPASGGSGYLTPPQFVADNGDLINSEINDDGSVAKLLPDKAATLYMWAPEVIVSEEMIGAQAQAIVRPNFRNKYQCYFRYANETVTKEQGGPLYSSLSPVNEIDCGDAAKRITWTIPGTPPATATHVELWRSTSNQATTLFKVAKLPVGVTTYEDNLSDYDMTDAKRTDFLAMPILLSDGRLNANRYGVASTDFAVGVVFQDRTFLGVDTTGKRPNTLLYSEADEPESIPEVNELVLQSNVRDTDYITALIPYAGALMVCQSRHINRLNFISRPEIDATTSLVAYRGCLNQRCWDIYMGTAYLMDDNGIYTLDAQGQVEDISGNITTLFRANTDPIQPTIDFSKREWFFLRADKNQGLIRIHVAFTGDEGIYPTRQIVYDPDSKSFWLEKYPYLFSSATEVRTEDGSVNLLTASDTGLHLFAEGLTDDGTPVDYAFRTGNMAFITDTTAKTGGQQNSRNVSVVYRPTDSECLLKLSNYYNGSNTPRGNVAMRDRGVGFVADNEHPESYVDMTKLPHQEAESHGIARALFAGKTIEAFYGNDTHVSLRLFGQQNNAGPVVIHSVDLDGVADTGSE